MKFGKEFGIHLEETLPEWRDKYLCYKPLKKLLKHIPTADDPLQPPLHAAAVAVDPPPIPPADLQDWFIRILSEELEKFNDFYVDKEEEFVIRFQELKQRIEHVKEKSFKNGVFPSESEFCDEMMDIRKDFVTIHGEMVLLKNYSSLNFAGIIKILKKYDKRTGGLLSLQFTQLALRQPFFTTEYLTRLVHECEENLELLFPLEAEVVESTSTPQAQMGPTPTTKANLPSEPSSSSSSLPPPPPVGDEASDVYRMTLAAMKTIKGLKKASSTYNPLSFASIFGTQKSDSSGAVTAENSDSDTPGYLQNEEEESKEENALAKK